MDRRAAAAIILAGTLASAAGLLFFRTVGDRRADAPREASDPALPAGLFARKFLDPEGREHTMGEWRERVLLVNFWATWCAPCRTEVPEFVALQDKYRDRGLVVLGLAIDEPKQVREFAREFGINYPLLIAGNDAVEIMHSLGNRANALPFSVIYDRDGRFVRSRLGAFRAGELETAIRPLIHA